jgi:hypothetical protein
MSLRVTSDAIQVHGGYGFTDEFPVSRFYRGARDGTLGGGTSERSGSSPAWIRSVAFSALGPFEPPIQSSLKCRANCNNHASTYC